MAAPGSAIGATVPCPLTFGCCMELTIFKLLIDIGLGMFDMAKKIGDVDADRKRAVGEWTHNLGVLIEAAADDIEREIFPHTTCAKMSYMVAAFPGMMDGLFDDSKIADLHSKLVGASNIEGLFHELVERMDQKDRQSYINKLRQTAGTMMGVGFTLQKDL